MPTTNRKETTVTDTLTSIISEADAHVIRTALGNLRYSAAVHACPPARP